MDLSNRTSFKNLEEIITELAKTGKLKFTENQLKAMNIAYASKVYQYLIDEGFINGDGKLKKGIHSVTKFMDKFKDKFVSSEKEVQKKPSKVKVINSKVVNSDETPDETPDEQTEYPPHAHPLFIASFSIDELVHEIQSSHGLNNFLDKLPEKMLVESLRRRGVKVTATKIVEVEF